MQLKELDDLAAEPGDGQEEGRLATVLSSPSLLRTALADSSLPQILLALGVVVVVGLIGVTHWSDLASGFHALAHASGGWLTAATLVACSLWFAGTITQYGSMPASPPVTRVFAVQVAASFANHLLPAGTGGMAVNVRFLRRHGLGRGSAVGSVGLNSLAGLVTHLILLATAVAISPAMMGSVRRQFDWTAWGRGIADASPALWGGILGGLVALGLVLALVLKYTRVGRWCRSLTGRVGHFRRRAVRALKSLYDVIRQPWRAAALWLGSLAVPLIHGLVLYTVLLAIHAHIDMISVMITYVVVSSLTALVPSPGGIGALDVALPAAFAAVGGISFADALAAVMGYRLLTVWLPLLPGAAVFTFLLRRRVI